MPIRHDGSIPQFLGQVAKALQRRLLLGRIVGRYLLWLALALVPGTLVLILSQSALTSLSIGAGSLLIIICGALLPLVLKPVTAIQAAAWLDQRLSCQDLFSAAIMVINHSRIPQKLSAADPGPFDQTIIDQAQTRIRQISQKQLFPTQILLRQSGQALALSIVAILLIFAVPTVFTGTWQSSTTTGENPAIPNLIPHDESHPRVDPQVAKEQARSLFPHDQRLANLAAEAIASGDMNTLQNLLDQASRGEENQPDVADNGMANSGSKQSSTGQGSGESPPDDARRDQKSGHNQDNQNRTPGKNPNGNTQPDNDTPKNPDYQTHPNTGGNDSDKKNQPNLSNRNGQAPGNNKKGERSPDGRADSLAESGNSIHSGPDLKIGGEPRFGQFDMVLGTRDARAPLSQVLPDSTAQALRAMGTNQPPLLYESYVRSYFRALAQEVKP